MVERDLSAVELLRLGGKAASVSASPQLGYHLSRPRSLRLSSRPSLVLLRVVALLRRPGGRSSGGYRLLELLRLWIAGRFGR